MQPKNYSTADHVLAVTPDNKVKADVQEPMRIVACSVSRDPSMSPTPLLLKSLSEVVDSDRNVFFQHGTVEDFWPPPMALICQSITHYVIPTTS